MLSTVQQTTFVCNGAPAPAAENSLIALTTLPVGSSRCPSGGTEIQSGLDTNGDGILESNEVTQTSYVCSYVPPLGCTSSVFNSYGYVSAGPWDGYSFVGHDTDTTCGGQVTSASTACATSPCSTGEGELWGTIAECSDYGSYASLGWNVNQTTSGGSPGTWAVPSSGGVTLTFTNPDSAPTRLVLSDASGDSWCAPITSGAEVLWSSFTTQCYSQTGPGTSLPAGTQIQQASLFVPGSASSATPFDICIQNIQVATPSCNSLVFNNGAVTVGTTWQGYGYVTVNGSDSNCTSQSTVTPTCGSSGCTPALDGEFSGTVAACSDYGGDAWEGWNTTPPPPQDGGAAATSWPVPDAGGITVTFSNPDNAPTRLVVWDENFAQSWCAPLTSGVEIPWSSVVTDCYASPAGSPIPPGTNIAEAAVYVPGGNSAVTPFDICVENIQVSSTTSAPPTTVSSCGAFDDYTVGSYVIENDDYNSAQCPGTQCITVNETTGAFTVTQGPTCPSDDGGLNGATGSYPNTLYGTSYGVTSPNSVLPEQVSAITSATSSWSFSVGGTSTDAWDVAYDIWFCPNAPSSSDACGGTSGFAGGTELMIWADYQNTGGYEYDLGPTTLPDGSIWERWTFTQSSDGNTWTYLAYLPKSLPSSSPVSLTNLNLLEFFDDAETLSDDAGTTFLQSSWYLYAVQAGIETRVGGMPFVNNSFSVSIE